MIQRRRCCLVVGPYRSGTSLVARILQQLGMNTGPEEALYEATDWNPGGYIQRPDITLFNTDLIKQAGGTLTDPGSPEQILAATQRRAFDKLDLSWMQPLNDVLIKDPRLCYTLYTWVHHGVLADRELHLVRVRRDIEATAVSALAHYDVRHYCDNQLDTARRVISAYDRYAAWHLQRLGLPAVTVVYEDLITSPETVVRALASFLGVDDAQIIQAAHEGSREGRSRILYD